MAMMTSTKTALIHKSRYVARWRILKRVVRIVIGACLAAIALEVFLVPNHIIDGGVTGISMMISQRTHIPLGLLLTVFNFPFLLLGYKYIGKVFALSSFLGLLCMSAGTMLFHHMPSPIHQEPLLGAIFGGLLLGVGIGIVLRAGGSLDGTEIVAILMSEKTPFSIGQLVLIINVFIFSAAGFALGWTNAMYSMIAYYLAMKTIDVVSEGLEQSKCVWIISDKYLDIGTSLARELGRGVTYLTGEGGFTGEQKKVIFIIITRLEEAKLKAIVEDYDSHAFLAMGNIYDVKGGGFVKREIHQTK